MGMFVAIYFSSLHVIYKKHVLLVFCATDVETKFFFGENSIGQYRNNSI